MMTDLSRTILDQIQAQTSAGLNWPADFQYPRYDGYSILNIPATAAGLLGGSWPISPPLSSLITDQIQAKPRNVIVILLDAISYQRFQAWREQDQNLVWNQLLEDGLIAPLTSISPSTTCSAITSLWTGAPAAQHGIIGYEMWLKEYGVTANMIEHKPITYRQPGGPLSLAGFDPETFLLQPSLTRDLLERGVEVHAFQHYAIINSGMSRMFMTEAQRHPISTAPDLWISIRELLEKRPETPKYIWAYWDKLDSISHFHGPDSERARAELTTFSQAFESYFLHQLDPARKGESLVILTADHGQITTDRSEESYQLRNHREFTEMLHLMPTGENRLAYLHVKPGKMEAVRDYIQVTWPEQFQLFDPSQAVEAGLFGPGQPHPEITNRLGDLIAAARGRAYWWWSAKDNHLIGRHGGLSAEEMLVPFLAARV